jgi:hypothetical protein
MMRHEQSIIGKGEDAIKRGEEPGDCIRACVASILELPMEMVPNFVHTGEDPYGLWKYALIGWLTVRGVGLDCYLYDDEPPGRWCIIGGPGPRGHQHCVVGFNREMVWDPHPSGEGLVTAQDVWYLVPTSVRPPGSGANAARALMKVPS